MIKEERCRDKMGGSGYEYLYITVHAQTVLAVRHLWTTLKFSHFVIVFGNMT